MSNMKDMTYEDLYLYCKDKNPDKKIVIYEDLGINNDKKHFISPHYLFLENGLIMIGKQLSKTDLIFG